MKLGPTKAMLNFLANRSKSFNLCIEIGAYEGNTSKAIVRHLSEKGKLICIDPLEDAYLTEDIDSEIKRDNKGRWKYFQGQYHKFMRNTKKARELGKIELIRKTSKEAFKELSHLEGLVDLCFIDGDHRTESVLADGIECFKLCKNGGYIIFDDYNWEKGHPIYDCGKGIDLFLEKYKGSYDLVRKTEGRTVQVIIKKNSN